MHKVTKVNALSNYRLELVFDDGTRGTVDLSRLVGKGVFAAFSDPDFFAQVGVGDRGRSLIWPGEIDFCADALWFETHPAEAPEAIAQAP